MKIHQLIIGYGSSILASANEFACRLLSYFASYSVAAIVNMILWK